MASSRASIAAKLADVSFKLPLLSLLWLRALLALALGVLLPLIVVGVVVVVLPLLLQLLLLCLLEFEWSLS